MYERERRLKKMKLHIRDGGENEREWKIIQLMSDKKEIIWESERKWYKEKDWFNGIKKHEVKKERKRPNIYYIIKVY